MEQPVPSDRIEEAWKAYSGYSRPAPFVSRDHEVSFEAFSQGYRAAMADLQELREAAQAIYDECDPDDCGTIADFPQIRQWEALRAALARLEGR